VPAVLCPKCRWPLSRAEARSGKCPFCAAPLGEAEAVRSRRRELPAPVDERGTRLPLSQSARPIIRGALILLALAAAGGGLYYGISAGVTRYLGGGDPPPAEAAQEPEAWPADLPAATPSDNAAPPAAPAAGQPAKPPAAPAPAEEKVGGRPVLPQEIVISHGVMRIDSPEGEYFVEPISGAVQVILRGKVKTLRIGSLGGEAFLDAGGLEAQKIVFAGAIGGQAKARVSAANGFVEFRGPVSGEPRVYVDAAGGKVTFVKPEAGRPGAEVNARLHSVIKAKEVDIQVPISGASALYVTLSAGGKLQFTELNGRSLLLYRKAAAGDPSPVIGWGIVRDDSRCKENK